MWSIPRYAAGFWSGRDAQTHALPGTRVGQPQNWGSAGVFHGSRRKGTRRIVTPRTTELCRSLNSAH